MSITLISDEEITTENLMQYVTIYAFTGDVPNSFNVTKTGDNEYTLTPVTAYDEGCKYRMTVVEGIRFKGLEDSVREYTFKI